MKHAIILFLTIVLFAACGGNPVKNKSIDELSKLKDLLAKVRSDYNMPAMAAAVITSDEIKAIEVSGVRQIYDKAKVHINDRFHLGSNSKAFTGFWAASLVESGIISWDTKLLDIFPHWEDDILKMYRNTTLSDLLSHRAYIQPFMSAYDIAEIPKFRGDATSKRIGFARWVLQKNPARVGNKDGYEYSNAGYSVATAMLEKASGTSWEDGIHEDVFQPLGISPIIGWPTDASLDQPYGHHSINPLDSNLRPVTKANMFEIQEILDPAGDISMSIGDYAKFIQANLQGVRGKDNFLKANTYEYVHYGRENYAMGWIRLEKDGVHISTHDGSAGTFYSSSIIYKEKDLAIVIFVNASNIYATKAVYSLRSRLLELYDSN